jgi:hypothetical protein
MNERRTAIRAKVDVAARFRREGENVDWAGRIDNISHSGLLLIAEQPLIEGARLRIAFDAPNGTTHVLVGDVVRTAPMGKVGVSFVHVEESTLRYVRDALGVS